MAGAPVEQCLLMAQQRGPQNRKPHPEQARRNKGGDLLTRSPALLVRTLAVMWRQQAVLVRSVILLQTTD
jgi:hypothetical protein